MNRGNVHELFEKNDCQAFAVLSRYEGPAIVLVLQVLSVLLSVALAQALSQMTPERTGMRVELAKETADRMIGSIRRYFTDQLDQDLGELQAKLLLDFVMQEIAPSIYNAAITDAQTYMRDRVADLDGACFVPEFGYWQQRGKSRK